jgi:DNA-binding NtrC family response regulator
VVFDIITYPLQLEKVALTVRNALTKNQLVQGSTSYATEVEAWQEWLPGASHMMLQLRERAMMLARLGQNVLITGDAGTGKINLAEEIHKMGPRAQAKMVQLNCTRYPTSVLQGMLFDGGQPIGAIVKDLNGGTLILDHIEALAPVLQHRLLYSLTHNFTNIRLICTATDDLYKAIENKKFDVGLYAFVSPAILHVPSLAERKEDIPAMVYRLAESRARYWHMPVKSFSIAAIKTLQKLPWSHNMRELKNSVDRLILLGDNPVSEKDVVKWLVPSGPVASGPELEKLFENLDTLDAQKTYFEKAYLQYILQVEDWNISRAAQRLGIQRTRLYHKMEQYGLKKEGP